jgi:DNA primase
LPRFSEQFIQQVVQATDIVDLVSRHVALKRAGKEFVGLCPFHDDHKPSMHVVPAKQFFYCFVCGAGGGPIKFVELFERLEFVEAVEALAQRANIPVPAAADQAGPSGPGKNDLLKANAFAVNFYRSQLKSPCGKAALDYALSRGISQDSIDKFMLGYAPSHWDSLVQAAWKEKISEQVLVAAGLAARREGANGCYDRFRNRLMFPILDVEGRAIAFGGRALDPDEKAKYLNSPESPLFDKSSNLYGLTWSRKGIVASETAIVVEGYLDVLMPLQFGVSNIVATLGTALNERHVRLLSRYAKNIVLVFDSDAAGVSAADRALEIFMQQRINVNVASVPNGKDPCDFVLANGAEAFNGLVAAAPDAMQYVWNRQLEQFQKAGGNLADRHRIVEEFLRLVATSASYGAIDEIRRGQLAQHIGHMVNIAPVELARKMKSMVRTLKKPSVQDVGVSEGGPRLAFLNKSEAQALEVLLNRPDLFDNTAERIDPHDFEEPALRAIAGELWRLGHEGRGGLEELLACESMSQYAALLSELAAEGIGRGNFDETLAGAVQYLVYRRGRQKLTEMAGDLSDENLRNLGRVIPHRDVRRFPRNN